MVLIEPCRSLILGIHDEGMGSNLGTGSALQCIDQQRTAKTLSLESPIDSQATEANGRYGRIAWQLPGDAGWEIGQPYTCGSQCVIAGNPSLIGQCHEACCHAAAHVLGGLFTQVLVQRFRTTVESSSIMTTPQRGDQEGRNPHSLTAQKPVSPLESTFEGR